MRRGCGADAADLRDLTVPGSVGRGDGRRYRRAAGSGRREGEGPLAELVYAEDLKSSVSKEMSRFESGRGYRFGGRDGSTCWPL
jgi:hypothetical protein